MLATDGGSHKAMLNSKYVLRTGTGEKMNIPERKD